MSGRTLTLALVLALVAAGCASQTVTRITVITRPAQTPHHARLRPASTTTEPATSPIDCQADGAGNGTWTPSDNNGAGGCAYQIDYSSRCIAWIVAPSGTFLVSAQSWFGVIPTTPMGFATYRWSDGTETNARFFCQKGRGKSPNG